LKNKLRITYYCTTQRSKRALRDRVYGAMATSSRIAPIRGDAPPFDFKQFTRDVVVPSDQALVLDKLPGWFRAASGVRMRDDVLMRSRLRARDVHMR
jgi:hypothetical protein